jgi:uncharacterized protein
MRKKLLTALLLSLVGTCKLCEPKLEERVISKYPSGLPAKIEFYAESDSGKVLVKETRFFSNGEKDSEGAIKNNDRHGIWKQWYENGELWVEESYSEGVKNGEFTVYYPSGKKNYSGTYEYGVPAGQWKFWNEAGEIVKEVKY